MDAVEPLIMQAAKWFTAQEPEAEEPETEPPSEQGKPSVPRFKFRNGNQSRASPFTGAKDTMYLRSDTISIEDRKAAQARITQVPLRLQRPKSPTGLGHILDNGLPSPTSPKDISGQYTPKSKAIVPAPGKRVATYTGKRSARRRPAYEPEWEAAHQYFEKHRAGPASGGVAPAWGGGCTSWTGSAFAGRGDPDAKRRTSPQPRYIDKDLEEVPLGGLFLSVHSPENERPALKVKPAKNVADWQPVDGFYEPTRKEGHRQMNVYANIMSRAADAYSNGGKADPTAALDGKGQLVWGTVQAYKMGLRDEIVPDDYGHYGRPGGRTSPTIPGEQRGRDLTQADQAELKAHVQESLEKHVSRYKDAHWMRSLYTQAQANVTSKAESAMHRQRSPYSQESLRSGRGVEQLAETYQHANARGRSTTSYETRPLYSPTSRSGGNSGKPQSSAPQRKGKQAKLNLKLGSSAKSEPPRPEGSSGGIRADIEALQAVRSKYTQAQVNVSGNAVDASVAVHED